LKVYYRGTRAVQPCRAERASRRRQAAQGFDGGIGRAANGVVCNYRLGRLPQFRTHHQRGHRSLDILHEHSLKVLETIERAYAEVNEVVRGMSDNDIRLNEAALNKRLKRIVRQMPQMQGIVIIDRNGHPLVSSNDLPAPGDIDFSKAEYFTALKSREGGTYVSTIKRAPARACQAISFHCRSAGLGATARSTVPSRLQS
jgi:hypothetical protein